MKISIFINRVVLFLLIMNSGGIPLPLLKNLHITFIALILILINIIIQKKYTPFLSFISLFFISFLLIINIICTSLDRNITTYLVFFSYFFTVSLFLALYKNKAYNLLKDLQVVLTFFMLYALFSFVMQLFVSDQLTMYNNISADYQARTFLHFVFYPKVDSAFIFLRNQGLFWEPGILQLYMNILFFICTFITKKKLIAVLSAILVVSTFSTTGLFILGIQLFILSFTIFQDYSLFKRIILFPLFFILFIGLLSFFQENFKEKIEGSGKRSSYARVYDAMTAINIIKAYPLCGIGLDNTVYYKMSYKYGYKDTELLPSEVKNRGGTNAILKLAYQLGLPIALVLLFLLYKQQIIKNKKLLFFIILTISLASEPILMSPFVFLLIISGIQNIISTTLNHKKRREHYYGSTK